jgi:hypothetical protein
MWKDLHIKVASLRFGSSSHQGEVAKIGIWVYAASVLPLCVCASCILAAEAQDQTPSSPSFCTVHKLYEVNGRVKGKSVRGDLWIRVGSQAVRHASD